MMEDEDIAPKRKNLKMARQCFMKSNLILAYTYGIEGYVPLRLFMWHFLLYTY